MDSTLVTDTACNYTHNIEKSLLRQDYKTNQAIIKVLGFSMELTPKHYFWPCLNNQDKKPANQTQ